MRQDQLNGILAFLRVAETRSFTRAAQELGITAPSLSETIRNLEKRLGVRLFNRTTRSVGLTEAGQLYLERVRPAVADILTAGEALKDLRDRPSGTLRLNLPWIAGPLLMDAILAPFMAAFPDVRLDIVYDDRFADIAAEGFDAGVRIGELIEKDMIAVRLRPPLRNAVIANPDYLQKYGVPETPSQLGEHRCIALKFPWNGSIRPRDFIQAGREIQFTPDPCLSLNTLPLVVDAAGAVSGSLSCSRAWP